MEMEMEMEMCCCVSFPSPHPQALREGGVVGVEEGLAPYGAAPSPSGVPDGWGDGDRAKKVEMEVMMAT